MHSMAEIPAIIRKSPKPPSPRTTRMKTIRNHAASFVMAAKTGDVRVTYSDKRFYWSYKTKDTRTNLKSTIGFYDKNATQEMIIEDMIDALKKDYVEVTGC